MCCLHWTGTGNSLLDLSTLSKFGQRRNAQDIITATSREMCTRENQTMGRKDLNNSKKKSLTESGIEAKVIDVRSSTEVHTFISKF